MPRFKEYDYDQDKLIPIRFSKQILPGTFEHTLNYLIDEVMDVSVFHPRYRNDETGAPAYDPALLLKVVLYAYARGILSSREIERACRENVLFMAISCDTQPHYTTIAHFISSMSEEIVPLFRDVLWYCDELGLIGKELFAIDGCLCPPMPQKSGAEPKTGSSGSNGSWNAPCGACWRNTGHGMQTVWRLRSWRKRRITSKPCAPRSKNSRVGSRPMTINPARPASLNRAM